MAKPKDFIVKTISEWTAPPRNDVRVLGMPTIPEQVMGKGCQPRTIEPSAVWDKMRRRCYFNANYTCEVCGKDLDPGENQAHELFSYNYATGEAKFERLICLCKIDHLLCIHTGRALTMFKHGDPVYSKKRLLEGAEHAFKLVSEYNKDHDDELLLGPGFLAYLREPRLHDEMEALIKKYGVRFYKTPKKIAPWEDWHVLYKGRKYMTPYKDHADWEKKMAELDKNTKRFEMVERYHGGVFDEIDKIIEEESDGH